MKGFATNDQTYYYLRITSITVNEKNAYELKGKFLDDLHNNDFSGANGEDTVEHIKYFLRIVGLIDLPNVNQDKLRVVVFTISLAGVAWKDQLLIDPDVLTKDIEGIKTYEEYKDDWIYEWNKDVPWVHEKPWTKNSVWKEPTLVKHKRWDGYEITDHDHDEREYEDEHEDEERCELFDDHELPVCNIRRFEMIKYSFGDDEEYVAIKENEYEDLTSTSEDAYRAYQEIFRTIDEGWMNLAAKKSTMLVKYLQSGNLKVLES
ncbi:hypothetical protein Tco_0210221 [Tanacetum coccineum]